MGAQVYRNGYFASFASFAEHTEQPLMAEFNRLAASQGWGRHGAKFRDEKKNCLRAEYFKYDPIRLDGGSNGDFSRAGRLGKLQDLCQELGIASSEVGSITKCKNVRHSKS